METKRPLILITNDDGIASKGIRHLASIAVKHGEVIIVAPADPQSAKSSALTVNSPLMVKEVDPIHGALAFTVNGTPVDCVKIAMHAVLDRRPQVSITAQTLLLTISIQAPWALPWRDVCSGYRQ